MSAGEPGVGGVEVLADRRGPVLILTFNRPSRGNAWTMNLEDQYFDRLAEADSDSDIRCVVVTGAGRSFCVGEDKDALGSADALRAIVDATVSRRPSYLPLMMRKPLVAAINGAAAGIGFLWAMCCDVRFANPGAKLTTAYVRRGLFAECGLTWLLPRMIGRGRALDLLLSGRIVAGTEAVSAGVVDFMCEPDALVDDAVAYARALAENCSPWSMAAIKNQVFLDAQRSFAESAADSNRLVAESMARPDVLEGTSSYLAGRMPEFPSLGPGGFDLSHGTFRV